MLALSLHIRSLRPADISFFKGKVYICRTHEDHLHPPGEIDAEDAIM
jgi:hypothetical protein